MQKSRKNLLRAVGAIGTLVCIAIFTKEPSFPTPDKLVFFLTFVFMSTSQALEMLKRLVPFVAILLIYESFRGVASHINTRVSFSFAPHADQLLFGNLPTVTLQNWLWHGHVRWYDFVFYGAYMMHFVLPIALALLVWKKRESTYWRMITTYLVVSFGGFLTFLLFPAAPPWMASDSHFIQPIIRISSDVWFAMGIHDFPSFYNHISPNPVAAVPSLHAAYATLFVLFVYKLFKKRWALLSCIYPFLIFVGTVYQGEHYAIDAIIGVIYALVAYWLSPYILSWAIRRWQKINKHFTKLKFERSSNTKNVLE